jgi:hypothetical protein
VFTVVNAVGVIVDRQGRVVRGNRDPASGARTHIIEDLLEKYCWLQAALSTTDVAHDRAFQTRFNGFYRVRRSADWQSAFYTLLQQEKSESRSFARVLRALHAATGRVEASFASKLAASIDPGKPVIDSFVLKNLGLRLSRAGAVEARLARIVELRDRIGRIRIALENAGPGGRVQPSGMPLDHVIGVQIPASQPVLCPLFFSSIHVGCIVLFGALRRGRLSATGSMVHRGAEDPDPA